MTTLLFSHDDFGAHEVPPSHVEARSRYGAVERALSNVAFESLARKSARLALIDEVRNTHQSAYCDVIAAQAGALKNAALSGEESLAQLDPDTFMGATSLSAALRGVGASVDGVSAILAGDAKNAFVASRPPGHHALADRAMGFCLFNNVVIAARAAHDALRAAGQDGRIAVLDFDVHHGNGTQAALWHENWAFFASSHEWPQYPGTGAEQDRGAHNNIFNVPLATGSGALPFAKAWSDQLLPALDAFAPEFVIISAGFDAHQADPVGGLMLSATDFADVTAKIGEVARDHANGRILSVLEGGYDLDALGESCAAHVSALMAL